MTVLDLNIEIITQALLKKDSDATAIVAFDVFDTLVTRIIPKEYSFAMMCRGIALRFLKDPFRAGEIEQIYNMVYNESCVINSQNGLDYETTTQFLLDGLVDGLNQKGCDISLAALSDYLVEFETALLVPMPPAVELLEALAAENIRCCYVSDMYLGAGIVDRILENLGMRKYFDAGFVSSDHGLLKRTGNLFPFVLNHLGLTADQVIFVGDDWGADVEQPTAHGIKAFHYIFEEIEQEREELRSLYAIGMHNRGDLISAIMRSSSGLIFENLSAEAFTANKYLGPYFASFAFAAQQTYRGTEYGNALFAAREGLFLLRLTDIFDRHYLVGHDVKKVYFPASRLTSLAYSFANRDFTLSEMKQLLKNGAPNLRNVLSFLQLSEDRLQEFCVEVGIDNPDVMFHSDWLNWSPLSRIIEAINNSEEFHAFKHQGELFHQWMQEQGILDGKQKLFVDLGWSGQIQDSLCRGFHRRKLETQINGIYSGMRLEAHWNRRPGADFFWFHCDEANPDIVSKAPFWFPQILETICRSPHGTVVGFEQKGGFVAPVFKKNRAVAEKNEDALISRMQELVFRYAERLAHLSSLHSVSANELRENVAFATFRFLLFPEFEVAQRFGGFCNVSDLGSSEVFTYVGGMGMVGFDEDRFKAIERTSLWPSGAVAAFFGEQAAIAYAEQFVRNMSNHNALVKQGGFTSFNPNGRLNSSDARMEQPVPPVAEAMDDWNGVVGELIDRVTMLANGHQAQEFRLSVPAGGIGLSTQDKAEINQLVDRALQQRGSSWPQSQSAAGGVNVGFADMAIIMQQKQAAEQLAIERYDAIQKMDQMIRERDDAIRGQEQMIVERWDAMQEMGNFIAERDRRILELEEALRAHQA